MEKQSLGSPLLESSNITSEKKRWSRALWFLLPITIITIIVLVHGSNTNVGLQREGNRNNNWIQGNDAQVIESEQGVVAADDGRCSEVGAFFLRQNGHAVDAAVATALCLGVVNPTSSGIGGGGFMILRSSSTSQTHAFDFRETAPVAASQNMYANNPRAQFYGALSMGVPGEIAGLHEAWSKHGRLAWKSLFLPAIKLAKDGFVVTPYLEGHIITNSQVIMKDPGLRQVFAPNGKLLKAGDTCYNVELGHSLEEIAKLGPKAFYNGSIGEKLVKDVREVGGILAMEDLRNYKVEVTDAMAADVMGYTVYGMPPPSSGTLGLSLILKIFESYGSSDAAKGDLGLHRLIEALKHMFAIRMNLGDPDFVNISNYESDMLSSDFAKQIRERIFDNTTFPPEYYLNGWSQLRDHGTSHFCIVDTDRNAVSMTTTVNYAFGGGVLSPSTGIVLNNEMGDFSTPTEITPDSLPPAPANFIRPNKRPLSSMTPIIVTKENQLVGALGGSGGMDIIPAVVQVFLNYFVLGMKPLAAVQSPRIYHKLIPNKVSYENWTVICGNHIELSEKTKIFLQERGHQVEARAGGAITQLVVQTLKNPIDMGRKSGKHSNARLFHGTLVAVSDLRKDGRPAAF
ncbi:Gamma-glutamyltranspeptidase [Parasponia andersonii]|uniref:Glutathione hydrolase n=1 Tax=Parasponia andersonii TaxID=3476 RepID=A0A2P5CN60_PARAD|nr:Gamma-glutamyltranspeptidase [Parasponia andersonii]